MKTGEKLNEYGNVVSVHQCETCGCEFTVIPPIPKEQEDDWKHCMATVCPSYEPARDADKLFDDPTTWCGSTIERVAVKRETKH